MKTTHRTPLTRLSVLATCFTLGAGACDPATEADTDPTEDSLDQIEEADDNGFVYASEKEQHRHETAANAGPRNAGRTECVVENKKGELEPRWVSFAGIARDLAGHGRTGEQIENCEQAAEAVTFLWEQYRLVYPTRDAADQEDAGGPPRIYNGELTHNPPVVRVLAGDNLCSGTVISRNHVLFSAHCVPESYDREWEWGKFAYTDSNLDKQSEWYNAYWYIHPDFDDWDVHDDVAIASIDGWSYPGASSSNRMRIYNDVPDDGSDLYIYGYGDTSNSGGGGRLRQADDGEPIEIDFVSASYFRADAGTARTCAGDSGSPTVDESTSYDILVGITSRHSGSDPCPNTNRNMYYTRADKKVSWIEGKLKNRYGSTFKCKRYSNSAGNYIRCW